VKYAGSCVLCFWGQLLIVHLLKRDFFMEVYFDLGRMVLKDYLAYYHKHSLDDAEYIPVVKVIINGIKKTMQAAEIGH
jgi:hypothetical protein